MKIENIYFPEIGAEVKYVIGQNQGENFRVMDEGSEEDWWFHAKDVPSCHVVAILPHAVERKQLRYILKKGALLCKMNTRSLKSVRGVEIACVQIRHLEKTEVAGTVLIHNGKEKYITL